MSQRSDAQAVQVTTDAHGSRTAHAGSDTNVRPVAVDSTVNRLPGCRTAPLGPVVCERVRYLDLPERFRALAYALGDQRPDARRLGQAFPPALDAWRNAIDSVVSYLTAADFYSLRNSHGPTWLHNVRLNRL